MNYLIFKEIMASILSKFRCQECSTPATENALSIQNLSGNNLELAYECPHCKTRALLSARLGEIKKEFLQTDMGRDMLQKALSHKNVSVI